MLICGLLVHISKNCSKLQILIGIMSTFSENYIQIDKVWPQLQPKTWSEAILKKYKSCTILSINSLQKCILEAVIDCLEIQSWLKGENVPNRINGNLQNAFLEAVNDKMVQTFVNSENGLGSRFRLSLRPIFRKCGYDTN